MSKVILVTDVKDFCEATESISDKAIQVYIDMISAQADACLDASNVPNEMQVFLKLNAVCHYATKATGGNVSSETDHDGASVSFNVYKADGYGLESTTFGQAIKSTGTKCFAFMDTRPSRFIQSFGRC